jgi:hypothetical protein
MAAFELRFQQTDPWGFYRDAQRSLVSEIDAKVPLL